VDISALSAREAEVLDALVDRLTNAEIAARLYISVRTVESHISSALRKLNLADRRQLAEVARANRARRFAVAGGLPRPDTTLIGRAGELDALSSLLGDAGPVTITGPGGAGKTRLAVEFARRRGVDFPDGVVFVELAPVREESLAVAAVAAALDVKAETAAELPSTIADYLARRRVLVVIDNCEHVLTAVADLAERICSRGGPAAVLATSREPLRLRNERRFPILPLPVAAAGAPADEVDSSPAVAVFAERARAADAGFRLTSDNRALVREVCARLEGLPLALELAAGRLGELSLRDLRLSIERSQALLDVGFRDSTERHRALRATFDWSYQLLDPAQQRLFERLSVFAGSFSLDAVETVCGFAPLNEDVAAVLAGLVAKSLVLREDDAYRLLEPVRQFAADLLAGSRHAEVADRHLAHFTRVAQ
jgi:predicted ATPase/DNA-binding CsgD family transcriptional regulator